MRLKLVYIYSFVVTLLYLLTACTDGIEASSDSNGQGEGKEIPVSIMPKLVAGDENEVSQLRVIIFSTRTSNPYGPKVLVSNQLIDVKKTLRDYTDRVTKGEIDFSTLARLYSEDKASAIKGGECGFMGRGMMDPAYANVAFSLQDPKKVSKIVESEFGFHIIQLIEKRGDRVNTRHILLRPKVSEKELTEACARLDSIADDIRANKFTFDDAAAVISQDKDTRNNHGIMVNINENSGVTTSKFQMQDLPQDVAKVVDKMNVGEISKAFTMINEKDGKEVCAIVKLKAKINGHKATIAEDYQDLKEIVMEKRREEMLQKWILDKQKHTYVRINDNWQKCDFKYPGWVKKD